MKVNNCIRNLLKFICLLQSNSTGISDMSNDCTKPFLGPSSLSHCYNTRVITLYNKDGSLFSGVFYDNNQTLESPYFRIQSIHEDCCYLLILNRINGEYVSTKQTMLVNIGCICAVKCLEDISINV